MWVKTKAGAMVNLNQAFEVQYDEERQELIVWMAFPAPSERNFDELASAYDTTRLFRFSVDPEEWGYTQQRMLTSK